MEIPFSINAAYLTEAEIDYELRIRDIKASRKTIQSKKIILRNQIEKATIHPRDLEDPEFNIIDEKVFINHTISELDSLIEEFSATKNDTFYEIITSRLASLFYRVNRFIVPAESNESHTLYKDYKEDARASCLELEAKLDLKIVPENKKLNTSDVIYPSSSSNKSVPVYKWGVKYDGNSSLKAFLERVIELSKARNVSETELFNSAIDLFEGQALIWYRSIRDKVSTWAELVTQLHTAFLPLEYDETLLDEIKSRKQGRFENISIYIAAMQNLFNRLATPLKAEEKLKIIRRNISPNYVERLALTEIKDVNDLITYCRKIDEATQIKSKYTPPKSTNFLESDLAYVENPGPSTPKNKNYSFNNAKSKNYTNTNSRDNNNTPSTSNMSRNKVSIVTCWNCRKTGHVYSACQESRNRFCFKCGKPNFTSKTCPICNQNSKN